MKRLLILAALFACIGEMQAAHAQDAPTLKERWQARAEARYEGQRPAGQDEILQALAPRLHRALEKSPAAKKSVFTTSPLVGALRRPSIIDLDLSAGLAGWRIRRDAQNGTPTFMTAPAASGKVLAVPVADPGALALAFVERHKALFQLQDPRTELRQRETHQDMIGQHHVRFQQQRGGVPVWGGDLVVHLDRAGRPNGFNGRYAPTPQDIVADAKLPAEAAIGIAREHLRQRVDLEDFDAVEAGLLGYEGPEAELYLREIDGAHRPVWQVRIRPNMRDNWHYFIDAVDGRVIEAYNNTQSEGPRTGRGVDLGGLSQALNVYESGGTFFMIDASKPSFAALQPDLLNRPRGALMTLDLRGGSLNRRSRLSHVSSDDNTWSDPVAVSAHHNMGRVFDYFLNTHGRLGLDGRGTTVRAVIHVGDGGRPMDNAFWNGAFVAFGDGSNAFSPLAGALDVAAHEMTHGVIERTVNLAYRFESGALNESFADVFAAMVDRDDWRLGEDIVRSRFFPSGAMRDMADPNNGGSRGDRFWQPSHMDEFVSLDITQDNGGVHINSGIPNRACFLIAEAIGRDKTEQIYYRVLDGRYLNTQATFVDMRLAAERAAADLYGEGGDETRAVAAAFDAVGVLASERVAEAPVDRTPAVGEQWIAVVNAEPDDNSLVLARPELNSADDIVRLTQTQVFTRTNNPISISADGAMIFFIDTDNFIRSIRPDGSDERVVSQRGQWASIALSPDGRRLAATTSFRDSTLFVFDLVEPDRSKAVRLYNPTTQENVRSYVTRFADALDWDHEGKFVLFDAFNTVAEDSATTIEFWRINVLDVDNELILPVFPAQPPNINIGNPSFAQTNDNFFTFDRVDFDADASEIWAANLFSGAARRIEPNGDSIGHPQYSPDDGELVFQRRVGGVETLRRIRLRDDKISAASASTPYAGEAQLPVWFTIGEEAPPETPTSIEEEAQTIGDFALHPNAPNPFNPATVVRLSLPREGEARLTIYNLLGQEVAVLAKGLRAAGEHAVRWDGRDLGGRPAASGVYFYRLQILDAADQSVILTRKMTLLR